MPSRRSIGRVATCAGAVVVAIVVMAASGATRRDGDITGDGAVNDSDFALIAANFGAAAGSASISEPSAMALMGLGIGAVLRRNRRNPRTAHS